MMRPRRDARGFSVLVATFMTIVVLVALGGAMYVMVKGVTPSGNPAIGALTYTRNEQGNYTVRVIALTNYGLERDKVSVVLSPYGSSLYVSNISGHGDYLGQGDTFTLGNLDAGTTYTVQMRYDPDDAVIASISITAS